VLPLCGDGLIQAGEQCDDANADDSDFCTSLCQNATCGDGFLHTNFEDCDDGNGDDTDDCTAVCELAACGDGFVHAGVEECDDANDENDDDCATTCEIILCGDGEQVGNEECDDANMDETDECTSACTIATCGDGFLHAGVETCDDGNLSNNDACVGDCVPAVCGDGFTQLGVEECDDANMNDSDLCQTNCVANSYGDDFETGGLMYLPWVTNAPAWAVQTTHKHAGMYAAKSGVIGHSATTSMEFTLNVPGPAVVRFWHRESSESGYDFLRFYVDNVQQGQWSGPNGVWAEAMFNVTPGLHTFRFSYQKDGSVVVGEDAVYVDDILFTAQ
jgi:cysteine-rich repeat protein